MRAVLLCLFTLCCTSAPALSPPPDPPPPQVQPRLPQIWIDPAQGSLQPIRLTELQIDVRMLGLLASTTLELRFHNPNDRVLEGEFVFPLAQGQSLTGYALEVDGQLREGVVVDKQTARVAFESITRQGIDPGLAELTRGNVFRTRLYPIPARGDKRVRLRIDQSLLDAGTHWRYVLPLARQTFERFVLRAETLAAEQAPAAGPGWSNALGFARWQQGWRASLERTDYTPQAEIAFDVPKGEAPVRMFRTPDPLDPRQSTVVAMVDTQLPATLAARAPRHIALYYDASGSAAGRDRSREHEVLRRWLATLGQVRVDLIAVRDAAEAPRRFQIRQGDSTQLLAAIEALPLDGGTSLGAIDVRQAAGADTVVIVSDGLSNFAGDAPQLRHASGRQPRLVLLSAASQADYPALERLQTRHAGVLLNLLALSADEALRRLQQPQWTLLKVDTGEACTEMAPAVPRPVDRWMVWQARCSSAAQVRLGFGDADTPQRWQSLKLADAVVVNGEAGRIVQRLWAAARIGALSAEHGAEDSRVTALAKQYGVVTSTTSMLVLDRIEDYVRYRVRPVEADLAAQYDARIASLPKAPAALTQDEGHLAQVLAQWQQFRDWHARPHPWLESLLVPALEQETARWQGLGDDPRLSKLAPAHRAELASLLKRGRRLAASWSKVDAQAQAPLAWQADAAATMLALDRIRMARLHAWPESDQVSPSPTAAGEVAEGNAAYLAAHARAEPITEAAMVADAMPAPAAAPPPAARPALALERQAAAPGGGAPATDARAKIAIDGDTGQTATLSTQARIQLADYNPDTPYMTKLRAATDPYAAYLRERAMHGSTPAFFLDCADFFRLQVKNAALALRILSNLAELDTENAPLVRVLAYRLSQWDHHDLAVPQFELALRLRGEEPQSRRDLALAMSRAPQPDWTRVVSLLWEVVRTPWDGRFPEIGVIALHDLNDVLARMPAAVRSHLDLEALGILPAFVRDPVPVDLRVVLTWDADNTDIDLWVIDPTGETAIYSHPQTRSGGQMSRDFTGGYGPEVYTLRRALPGTYIVKAHYYGDRVQKLTGAVTVQVEFLTDFAGARSQRAAVTRRLEGDDATLEVGRFTVGTD